MYSPARFAACLVFSVILMTDTALAAPLRVGAAAIELEADDSMIVAGSIHPWHAKGQEGKLRATALVLEKAGAAPIAIVSCDVLIVTRDFADLALGEIEKATGIPAGNVLIHATHTHHAPSTVRVHGYGRCEVFVERLKKAIMGAVVAARARLNDSTFSFKLGREETVGMNSRLRLGDGTIYWSGSRADAVGPTGPFDGDLPVLAFRSPSGKLQALLFGHATHTIGSLRPGVRSPAFYGLVAQELEAELGGPTVFLEGASGSTHVMNKPAKESFRCIKQAVLATLAETQPRTVEKIASIKHPFRFKVRTFDEAAEDRAVSAYCKKRMGAGAEAIIKVFRQMRQELAPLQGQQRSTWLQVMALDGVAIVGIPAEMFTRLGLDIKRRSPFRHTVVAELANDWIGYVGDREAYQLGGYQMWMGLHSYVEPGTGERMVDEAVDMLKELAAVPPTSWRSPRE
jgi:hypothetical protein